MKRLLSLVASLLFLSSGVGCCCLGSHSLCSNDPCSRELAGGGCCWYPGKFLHGKCCLFGHGKCRCGGCGGCGSSMGCGGCGMDGGYPGMIYGDMGCHGMPGMSGDCGCASGATYPPPAYPMQPTMMHPPIAPQMQMAPPAPAAIPPAANAMPAPMPDAGIPAGDAGPPMTSINSQPQQVSAEEFQRLPGSIITGPQTTTVPQTMTAPQAMAVPQTLAAPAVVPAPTARPVLPTAALPGVQPTNWQPARRY